MIGRPRDSALDTLAREELGIDPEELGGSAWEAAITSFLLFAVGAIVPVLPFFFLTGMAAVVRQRRAQRGRAVSDRRGDHPVTGRSVLYSGMRQVIFGLAPRRSPSASASCWGLG